MFLLEVMTPQGRRSESFASYDEARARLEAIPDADLIGMPLIFQALADGSQRVVRDDGKPLQAHRPTLAVEADGALPLAEEDVPLGELRAFYTPQDEASSERSIDPCGRLGGDQP